MKKLIFCLFLFTALFYSCSERIDVTNDTKNVSIDYRNSDIDLEGDLLSFSDHQAMKSLLYQLRDDETVAENRLDGYAEIGITSDVLESGIFVTQYPLCESFENSIGFNSLRSIEENEIHTQLNNGAENVFSIVSKPYLKTVLNEFRCVKIGNRIYKLFDNGFFAVVAYGDLATYNEVKFMNYEELLINPMFGVGVYASSMTHLVQSIEDDGESAVDVPIISPKYFVMPNASGTKFTILNRSLIETENFDKPICVWRFPEGEPFIGQELPPEIDPITYIVCDWYPPTGPTGPPIHTDTIPVTPRACEIEAHVMGPNNDGEFIFWVGNLFTASLINNSNDCQEDLLWTFSDGTTENGCVVVKKLDECDVNQQGFLEGVVTSQEWWNCEDSVVAIPDNFNCEETREMSDDQIVTHSNGDVWKIDVTVWVETSGATDWATPGEIGCRTRAYKRKPNGGFESKNADVCGCQVMGTIMDKDENCAIYDYLEVQNLWDASQAQVNIDHHGARKHCSHMKSRHGIEVDGEQLFYIKNGSMWFVLE